MPRYSNEPAASAGSTVIPHTGSMCSSSAGTVLALIGFLPGTVPHVSARLVSSKYEDNGDVDNGDHGGNSNTQSNGATEQRSNGATEQRSKTIERGTLRARANLVLRVAWRTARSIGHGVPRPPSPRT